MRISAFFYYLCSQILMQSSHRFHESLIIMTYDFNTPIDRYNTDCYKYDSLPSPDTIGLWVADMDFETAPCVLNALRQRLQHGCFGYTKVPESFYESTINWFSERHGWNGIQRDWFIYTSGVVPAVSAIIKAMTKPGDAVLVQTPAYNCFFSSIRNNDCETIHAPLEYETNAFGQLVYHIDYEKFENLCSNEKVKVFLLCNPHNPTGRIWTREELTKMAEICQRHNIFIIADEIHCEFAFHDRYTPFATVALDTNYAVCVSPSKAFNIAGLQIANIIIPDADIRTKVDRAININEVCDVNPFGVIALQAAYTPEGAEWLTQLNEYICQNYLFTKDFLARHVPSWHCTALEGTYLLWVNVADAGTTGDALADLLLREANVCVNSGSMYGDNNFIRINLATQKARLQEALERIAKVVEL